MTWHNMAVSKTVVIDMENVVAVCYVLKSWDNSANYKYVFKILLSI